MIKLGLIAGYGQSKLVVRNNNSSQFKQVLTSLLMKSLGR